MHTGGYLDRLEKDYGLIQRVRPILAKSNSRSVKYFIKDNFLRFWFRFIYKNQSAVEIGNLEYTKELVKRDLPTFSGYTLEKFFRQNLAESKQYNNIGVYWESKNLNEIDIVAINDKEKKVLIAEVKRDINKVNLQELEEKSAKIKENLQKYTFEYKAFGLESISVK